MNKKVSILTELGEVKFKKDWQNYLQYNFSEKDIPDIVDLIINEQKNIKNANEGDPIVWASLHAWRALGQLESPKAIQPLISQFNQLCGDDWALAEIEIVMGMIGEQAIEPIFLYLKDKRRNEFSRIMASSCLAEIALQNSPLREVVIEKFRQYLIKPDSKSRALNGLIITRLEKLKATELINEIRQLFINDVVDNLACGDIEDVEISLGLRDKRETPKPKYGALSGLFPEDGGEAETEHDRLRDMLIKYGNEESIFNSSELDGYFASIACSPVLIQPSQWMPLIWGEDDHQPEWKDQTEVQEYLDLLMSHYNEVIDDFQYNDYEPLYLETDVTGKTELIVTGWCAGFMRGSLLWLTKEFRSDPVLKKLLKLFIPFLSDDEEILERYSIEIIKDYQSLIEPQVNDLYQHFFEQRLPPEVEQSFIRDIPKVGRNDSCPCGSGKKFKKCCLH